MKATEILAWLLEENPEHLRRLWILADQTRRKNVGDAVHLRGLIEFSNYCRSHCLYCGMRRERKTIPRYRMAEEEILASAKEAERRGYGTIVLQSGEDPEFDAQGLANIVRTIKQETSLAVTLSCGERSEDELAALKEAGADRYFLRFETSDRLLWKKIHPGGEQDLAHRLDLLPRLRELGYEVGSGIMVGIPGQTWSSLVEDLLWFKRLDLDMIGCGPFVPHPDTPLGREFFSLEASPYRKGDQVPNTDLVTLKVIALTRLLCPQTNIPSTTALATINSEQGYRLGLQRGANVLMVNLTPLKYRSLYEIYPAKAGIYASPQQQLQEVKNILLSLGRIAGQGPGPSLNYEERRQSQGQLWGR